MRNHKFVRAARKAASIGLAAALALTAVPVSGALASDGEAEVTYYYGDANLDGEVAVADALLVLQHYVGLEEITDELALELADIDHSDDIAVADALKILQVYVGLDSAEVYEEEAVTEAPEETEVAATDVPEETEAAATTTPTEAAEATVNPAYVPNAIPTVEPGEVVEGTSVEIIDTNGAEVDEETGIITFTDENAENGSGVQFTNPLAGRSDLRETVEEALEGQTNSNINSWSNTLAASQYDESFEYPVPKWSYGVSVSFWVKCDWKNGTRPDSCPLLVIHDDVDYYIENADVPTINTKAEENFTLMVRMNGSVSFEAGDDPLNSFRATSYLAGNNNEWNYYTVTFTNDWITVYVNGQENVYKKVVLLKDKGTKYFNDGFMTRYNTIGTPTLADVEADIRGYLVSADAWDEDTQTGNKEAGIIGNGRYANAGAVSDYSPLLMDYLTGDDTELWIGGTTTKKLVSTGNDLGIASYSVTSGTQIADVQVYDVELTAEQVAANYEAATVPGTTTADDAEE